MDKYTAEIIEDALSLLKFALFFCGISYLVWWHNFGAEWYLLLLFVQGYQLMENIRERKKIEKEFED